MRVIIMGSDGSLTENSLNTFQGKDHELLAYVDSLANVYLDNTMLTHSLWYMRNKHFLTWY